MKTKNITDLVRSGLGRIGDSLRGVKDAAVKGQVPKRVTAGVLTAAMVLTNALGSAGTAFASGRPKNTQSLFLVESGAIQESLAQARRSGDTFDYESLAVTGEDSAAERYAQLLGGDDVYELNVNADATYAAADTGMRVFYNEGSNRLVFLFLNAGDAPVDFRVNIDGYEAEALTVEPGSANVKEAESESAEENGSAEESGSANQETAGDEAGGVATQTENEPVTEAASETAETETVQEQVTETSEVTETESTQADETKDNELSLGVGGISFPVPEETSESTQDTEVTTEETSEPVTEEIADGEVALSSFKEIDGTENVAEPVATAQNAQEENDGAGQDEQQAIIPEVEIKGTFKAQKMSSVSVEDGATGAAALVADYTYLMDLLGASTVYQVEMDDAIVTVTVPNGTFEDTVTLEVSRIEDEEQLLDLATDMNKSLDEEKQIAAMLSYDIVFVSAETGAKIEPTRAVSVVISLKKPLGEIDGADRIATLLNEDKNEENGVALISAADDGEETGEASQITEIAVVHTPDEGASEVVATDDNPEATEFKFEVNSLSPFTTYGFSTMANVGTEINWGNFQNMENGGTFYLNSDFDITIAGDNWNKHINITSGKSVTLDLNGHTIGYGRGESLFYINGGSLTIKGSGTIQSTNSCTTAGLIYIVNGTLNIEGGTIRYQAGGTSVKHGIFAKDTNGAVNITINGGTIDQCYSSNGGPAIYFDASNSYASSLTITGGNIINQYGTGGANGGAIYFKGSGKSDGDSVKISGGTIGDSWAEPDVRPSNGGGLYVENCGTVTISGGTITGNEVTGNGGGIYLKDCGDTTVSRATISHNNAGEKGGGIFALGTNVTLGDDSSTQKVDISYNTAGVGGGGVYSEGTTTINAGTTIQHNNANGTSWGTTGGGGILQIGTLTMNGGSVIYNKAQNYGGGIHVIGAKDGIYVGVGNSWPERHSLDAGRSKFYMYGGTVSNNTAQQAEGGGIRIAMETDGHIEATKGSIYIEDNTTNTMDNWGGGGIFVAGPTTNEDGTPNGNADCGTLKVYEALITENTAGGFGGGLTGCPTGTNIISDTQKNVAIYGNSASGAHLSSEKSYKGEDHAAANDPSFQEYKDYYCEKGSLVRDVMLGGGSENWKRSSTESVPVGGYIQRDGRLGLTADPDSDARAAALEDAKVFIRYNSSYTHGGGILNNGTITFGGSGKENGEATIWINKQLNGLDGLTAAEQQELKGKVFTFTLYNSNANKEKLDTVDTATATALKSGAFDPITLGASDVGKPRYYLIEEQSGTEQGFTYDTNKWFVTITTTVIEDPDPDVAGRPIKVYHPTVTYEHLTADGVSISSNPGVAPAAAGNAVTFINTYTPPSITYQPKVTKVITGDGAPAGKKFTFTLTAASGNLEGAQLPDGTTATVSGEGSSDGSGNTNFGKITFTKAGTYNFTISETKGSEKGFTYDEAFWNLKVVVANNGGKLEVTEHTYTRDGSEISSDTATFTNTYTPASVTYRPKVKKEIIGENAPDEKTFTFNLTLASGETDGVRLPADTTTTVSGAGQASFGEITFTKAGTYSFTINETAGSESGYTYDTSTWTLEVVVTDNNGALAVESHTYTKTGGEKNTDAAAFTNIYNPADATYQPKVKKEITGEATTGSKTFTFTLDADATNLAGVQLPADTTATVTGDGETSFGAITFTKAGTYSFTISEKKENEKGYTYDTSTWTLKVVVEDNGGRLEVTGYTYTKADGTSSSDKATFTNTYDPADATYQPKVTKEITGETTPSSKTFTFTLAADAQAGAQLPANTTATVTGSGTANFGDIKFTKAGTYNFTISENAGADAGYTYDTSTWTLKIKVEDKDGTLEVTKSTYTKADGTSSEDTATFTNTYDPTDAIYQPKVTKALTGETTPSSKTFTFTLTADATNLAGAQLPTDTTATVTGSGSSTDAGNTSFGAIAFTKAGTYHFTISEEKGSEKGYTYDGNSWTLEVVVTDNGGTLEATGHTYMRGSETSEETATFTNTYTVTEAQYTPSVTKKLEGSETPNNKTFNFEMTAASDNPEGGAALANPRAQTNGEGTATFGMITFTKAGTYNFTIREIAGNDAGYGYDNSTWNLTVEVEDQDSVLAVTSSTYTKYDANGEPVTSTTEATFTNTYTVTPAEIVLGVQKELTGAQTPEDAEFTFSLEKTSTDGSADGAELPTEKEVTVTGAGNASFGAITFNAAGTYRFEVKEISGNVPGYHYDTAVWQVEVTVEDHDSILEVTKKSVVRKDGTGETAQPETVSGDVVLGFVNEYNVEAAGYAPEVTKRIDVLAGGSTPKDKTFTFTLEEDAGNPKDGAVFAGADARTASTTGAGSVRFPEITFTQAGTYRFAIRETDGGEAGYGYDKTVWNLEVTVEDIASILTVTGHTYTSEAGSDENGAVFTNTYTTKGTSFTPKVRKEVAGADTPVNKTFAFAITALGQNPEGGAQIDGATNVEIVGSGEASFGTISFSKAGTYRYEIRETAGNEKGYTYDASVWTLTVEVRDAGGELVADSWSYTNGSASAADAAEFVNRYDVAAVTYAPQITKRVLGVPPRESEFTFLLEADGEADGYAFGGTAARITGAGSGSFDPITFTKAGTYRFTIREEDGGASGYTYDESVWTLEVRVKDEDAVLTVEGVTYAKDGETAEAAGFTNRYASIPGTYTPPTPQSGRTEEIPENPTPLASAPTDLTMIADEDVPLAAPRTGDNMPAGMAAFFSLLALSMVGIFGVLGFRKKEEK